MNELWKAIQQGAPPAAGIMFFGVPTLAYMVYRIGQAQGPRRATCAALLGIPVLTMAFIALAVSFSLLPMAVRLAKERSAPGTLVIIVLVFTVTMSIAFGWGFWRLFRSAGFRSAVLDSELLGARRSGRERTAQAAKADEPVLSAAAFRSLVLCPLPFVGLPVAIYAHRSIKRSGGRLRGLLLAKVSIVLNALFLLLLAAAATMELIRHM